jgi:hypothetical protein
VNEDDLSSVRRESSWHFGNKKGEYLKDRINELETNSKNKNFRDSCSGMWHALKGEEERREGPKERDHSEDRDIDGRMGSKGILGRLVRGGVD